MATVTITPPGFFSSVSGSAKTASSWSLASAGSMVISGRSRQSSRPAMVAGLTASASAITSAGKMCGISWAWMAIIETAFSLVSEPSTVSTLARGRP